MINTIYFLNMRIKVIERYNFGVFEKLSLHFTCVGPDVLILSISKVLNLSQILNWYE